MFASKSMFTKRCHVSVARFQQCSSSAASCQPCIVSVARFQLCSSWDGSMQTKRDKCMKQPGQDPVKLNHNKHTSFNIQTTIDQKPKDIENNARCSCCEGKHKLEVCMNFTSKTCEKNYKSFDLVSCVTTVYL